MNGTFAFSTRVSIRLLPPLGTIKSMYSFSCINLSASSRSLLLINRKVYNEIGKEIISELINNDVELFVDKDIKNEFPSLEEVTDTHFATEFHDLKLAVGIVDTLDEAIEHIQEYSSGHTEGIISESTKVAEQFSKSIDSSVIFINTSTRFTDGEMFGFGAEVGISTQKLHVRGPMGLEALTTERYVVTTEGIIRK